MSYHRKKCKSYNCKDVSQLYLKFISQIAVAVCLSVLANSPRGSNLFEWDIDQYQLTKKKSLGQRPDQDYC